MYQNISANQTGMLPVSDRHTLYWETSGNPDGKPAVFLHGGPGAGCSDKGRCFFDPERYHIIQFDQRGCGRSTPHACVEENTTWDLVADIEQLRRHLGIEQWLVFGGSWGSCLALAYAQQHPESVSELVLRGIFLSRQAEIAWLFQSGASQIFSEAWQDFIGVIAQDQRHDLVNAYHHLLFGEDETRQYEAARAWTAWEASVVHLEQDRQAIADATDDRFALSMSRIENHYFVNHSWFPNDDFLLDSVDKIRHIPTVIVQGRYDICTPFQSAWDLHQRFPEAELQVVIAGHSAYDPEIQKALVAATDRFADLP